MEYGFGSNLVVKQRTMKQKVFQDSQYSSVRGQICHTEIEGIWARRWGLFMILWLFLSLDSAHIFTSSPHSICCKSGTEKQCSSPCLSTLPKFYFFPFFQFVFLSYNHPTQLNFYIVFGSDRRLILSWETGVLKLLCNAQVLFLWDFIISKYPVHYKNQHQAELISFSLFEVFRNKLTLQYFIFYFREDFQKNSKIYEIYQKGGVGLKFYFCNCDIRGWVELCSLNVSIFGLFLAHFHVDFQYFGQIE